MLKSHHLIHNDRRKLRRLIEILHDVSLHQENHLSLERILRGARFLVNADAGTIYLKSGSSLRFHHVQNDTLQNLLSPGETLLYKACTLPINNDSISGYVASTGKLVNVHDVYQLKDSHIPYRFNRSYDERSRYRTHSMLTIPLMDEYESILGVMQLINARNSDGQVVPFFGSDLPMIRLLANRAVEAIERLYWEESTGIFRQRVAEPSIGQQTLLVKR